MINRTTFRTTDSLVSSFLPSTLSSSRVTLPRMTSSTTLMTTTMTRTTTASTTLMTTSSTSTTTAALLMNVTNATTEIATPFQMTIDALLMQVLNCTDHVTCYADSEEPPSLELVNEYCNFTREYDLQDRCCGRQIQVDETDARPLNTILNVWLMGLFGMIGVISNILAAVVLSHPKISGTSTSLYLRALAVSDLTLCFVVTMFCLADFGDILPEEMLNIYIRAIPYVSVLPHVSRLNSILLVIAVTVERYVAVCHPLKATRFCTIRNCRFLIVTIFLIAVAANSPRWHFLEHTFCFGSESNIMTDFFLNPLTNIIYNVIFEAVIYCICPFTILSLFNFLLLKSVRRSTAFIRASKSAHERRAAENQRQLTIMLLVVVAAFVTCQVPAVMYAVIVRPLVLHDPLMRYNEFVIFIDQIRNFPVMLNSALNFWLYCAAGQKFREVLIFMFCTSNCLVDKNNLQRTSETSATSGPNHPELGRLLSARSSAADNHLKCAHSSPGPSSRKNSSLSINRLCDPPAKPAPK